MGDKLQRYFTSLLQSRQKHLKWLSTFLCLALAVTLTTSAILSVSAVAVTDDRTDEVGMVREDASILSDETSNPDAAVDASLSGDEAMLTAEFTGADESLEADQIEGQLHSEPLPENENILDESGELTTDQALTAENAETDPNAAVPNGEVEAADPNADISAAADGTDAADSSTETSDIPADIQTESVDISADPQTENTDISADPQTESTDIPTDPQAETESIVSPHSTTTQPDSGTNTSALPAEQDAPASPFPAQTFDVAFTDLTIHVEADEGAFPADTTMIVTPISSADVTSQVEQAVAAEITHMQAVDISFYNTENEKIEPLVPIRVSMRSTTLADVIAPQVVHIKEDNASEIVEQIAPEVLEQEALAREEAERLASESADSIASTADTSEAADADSTSKPSLLYGVLNLITGNKNTDTSAADPEIPAGSASDLSAPAAEVNFDADSFSIYAIVGTLENNLLATDGQTYRVSVTYDESAQIPEGATLSVSEIVPGTDSYNDFISRTSETIGASESRISYAKFIDISIWKDGERIQPAAPVDVRISLLSPDAVENENNDQTTAQVVHFGDAVEIIEGAQQEVVVETAAAEESVSEVVAELTTENAAVNTEATAEETSSSAAGETAAGTEERVEVSFAANGFSVYGVVYTVDFHWNVDGKTFEYSLAGGDAVSFRDLVQLLHVTEEIDNTSEEESEPAKEEADESENGSLAEGEGYRTEEIDQFFSEVEEVRFSDESLVKVVRITEELADDGAISAGTLKERLGLEYEYSAELSELEREIMDSRMFYVSDWALISMKAFDTEEYLSVVMKTGEEFRIRVTDAQITKDYITASGETFTITVIYGEDAGIPNGSELVVDEIGADTQQYETYLTNSAIELGVDYKDISFARFFNIEITSEGEKIEPKNPVQVKIKYVDSVDVTASLNVVHFADEGTEIISDVSITDDGREIVYEQKSFSVTGTVVTPVNNNQDHEYMLLIKGPLVEGKNIYYIINNDGTLSPVSTEWNTDGSLKAVHVTEPMAWNYRNNHIYHEYDAMAYNPNHAAAEFVYRYLNPAENSGLTTETNSDVRLGNYNSLTQMYENSQRRLWGATQVVYDAQNHRLSNNGHFLGVSVDADGTLRIAGNRDWNDSAEVYFAKPEVVAPTAVNHAVNHIDISVKGTSEIEVPLAFGEYFDANGVKLFEVSRTEQKTITAESPVKIELEDMKRVIITAYQKDADGTILPLNDAFYISGFSQNDPSGIGSTGDARQIRIEGSFLTSKSIHGENIDQFDNATQTYKNRLNDRVYYTISVTKPITFVLKEGETELYDATGKPLTITLDITMTASFDYWDIRNDCPPLRMEMNWDMSTYVDEDGPNYRNWQQGGYTHWTGDMTGMDFQLGGNAEDANSNIVAVEITKMIMDPDGNLIRPANEISQSFEIWRSSTDNHKNVIGIDVPRYAGANETYDRSSYSYLHSKDMKVGNSGMGLVYDYEITPGMYYIREDPSKIQKEIVDQEGKTWQYKETRLETEFVWRNDDTVGRHVSATYQDRTTTDSHSYISIPEVAGVYTGKHYHNAVGYPEDTGYDSNVFYGWNEKTKQMEDNQPFRNGFLEFFVYNVYEPVNIPVTVKKVDEENVPLTSADTLTGAAFRLEKYADSTYQGKATGWTDITLEDSASPPTGTFKFEGLTEGYYQLVETKTPTGYVKASDNPRFHVKQVDENLVIVLVGPDGADLEKTVTDLLKVENSAEAHTLTVGNTPGAALPNTGGPGTDMYKFLGLLLTIGAGILLLL